MPVHHGRHLGRVQGLREVVPKQVLARPTQLRSHGRVDELHDPVLHHGHAHTQVFEHCAVTGFRRAQRFDGLVPLDHTAKLVGHERQHLDVFGRIGSVSLVVLHHQHATHSALEQHGHAQPCRKREVTRGFGHVTRSHQRVKPGPVNELRALRTQHKLGQPTAHGHIVALHGVAVFFVHVVRKIQRLPRIVAQAHIEVAGVQQLAQQLMNRLQKTVKRQARCGTLGHAVQHMVQRGFVGLHRCGHAIHSAQNGLLGKAGV